MTALGESVERAARALGVWRDLGAGDVAAKWTISRLSSGWFRLTEPKKWRDVDDYGAALWLLCHALPETERRCPACAIVVQFGTRGEALLWCAQHGRSQQLVAAMPAAWTETTPPDRRRRRRGEPRPWWGLWLGDRWARCEDIGCSTCATTGYVPQSWAEVVLDAMPRPAPADDGMFWTDHRGRPITVPGCSRARERIAVLADELQTRWRCPASCPICHGSGYEIEGTGTGRPARWASGDNLARMYPATHGWTIRRAAPSGWLAKRTCPRTRTKQLNGEWLALWHGEAPCRACAGTRRINAATGESARDGVGAVCWTCHGSGHELASHEPAILAALDRVGEP